MTKQSHNNVEQAIAARDTAALAHMLDTGLDANWKDDAGNTLLHHAARFGDTDLINKLQALGANAFVFNAAGDTPWDTAVMWGNNAAAARISSGLEAEIKAAATAKPITYKSMQEIRDASSKNGVSEFYVLAQNGQFAQVAALAEKDGGFVAGDLLGKGANGDSAALKLAQFGQLDLLMKPALWIAKPEDFQKVWDSVPANYRSALDYPGFIADLRQAKLQSYAKPKLPGFKPGPKP